MKATNTALIIAVAFMLAVPASAQTARAVLENAQRTIGTAQTVQFTATGRNGFFGQALTAGKEWPLRDLTSATGAVNYDQKSAKLELVFKDQVFGGQRQNAEVNGDRAWNIGPDGNAAPQLGAAEERQTQIWMTPHGFVRAGLAAAAPTLRSTTVDGKKARIVSFMVGRLRLNGTVDDQGLVTRVETLLPNTVLGDMPYSFTFSNYKDFGGVKFPGHIVQSEGGFVVNDLTISDVRVNAPFDLPVPANVQAAVLPPVRVESAKLGDGVWFVGGGSHHSVVVEFSNFLAVIEGPLAEDRSLAVIAEAKRLAPMKPIRYVVSTHHHFDHSGGLRTYVAEGATVVTHVSNKAYFEKSFVAPATIVPDAQSKARRKPTIQPVTEKYVISDGKQSIDVYSTMNDGHSDELLVAYIPSVKVLVEADSFSPGPPNAPPPNPVPPNALVLYDNLQRLKLDVATVVGIHGRGPVPIAEFRRFVGKG